LLATRRERGVVDRSRKLTRVLMLASLAAINLVVDFGLWSTDGADGFLGLLFLVAVGTALSQILLLALWFSCMNGGWLWRFVVPMVLTALIGYTAAIGLRAVSTEPWAKLVFPLVFQFPLFGLTALARIRELPR
jgi:hypothetical protein